MIINNFVYYLNKNGLLAASERVNRYLQPRFERMPLGRYITNSILWLNKFIEYSLDRNFDRKYGTNTSGVIPINKLKINSGNTQSAVWYEPMSQKIFKQIMNKLNINFREFVFIDFGSGKGRVLLMASIYGFKKILGVEFAQDLHFIAQSNIDIYKAHTKSSVDIESACDDATKFVLPNEPLVLFFYSPFKGRVMESVLKNISQSYSINRRKIILIFYGNNAESIELLKSINFEWEELKLKPDLKRIKNYRGFVFQSL